jgi:HEAT repeat protein
VNRNLLLLIALCAGFGAGYFAGARRGAAESADRAAAAEREAGAARSALATREAEAAKLAARLADLENAAAGKAPGAPRAAPAAGAAAPPAPGSEAASAPLAPPAAAAGPAAGPSADEAIAALRALAKKGLAAYGEIGPSGIVDKMRALGPDGVAILSEMLRDPSSAQRFLAAAVLEGLHDPSSIAALESATRDPDLLVQRMAAHALATLGTRDAVPALESAMNESKDPGVRANAAYGLAKLGEKSGIDALLEMWRAKDLDPSLRTPILGGIMDAGQPQFAPVFRPLIADRSQEYTCRLMGILGAAKIRDPQAIPALESVIGNPEDHDSLREAAKKAVNEIKGEQVYRLE